METDLIMLVISKI